MGCGYGTRKAVELSKALKSEISSEVIDIRALNPFDAK